VVVGGKRGGAREGRGDVCVREMRRGGWKGGGWKGGGWRGGEVDLDLDLDQRRGDV